MEGEGDQMLIHSTYAVYCYPEVGDPKRMGSKVTNGAADNFRETQSVEKRWSWRQCCRFKFKNQPDF